MVGLSEGAPSVVVGLSEGATSVSTASCVAGTACCCRVTLTACLHPLLIILPAGLWQPPALPRRRPQGVCCGLH